MQSDKIKHRLTFKVRVLDAGAEQWKEADDISDAALFVGVNGSLCVPRREHLSLGPAASTSPAMICRCTTPTTSMAPGCSASRTLGRRRSRALGRTGTSHRRRGSRFASHDRFHDNLHFAKHQTRVSGHFS